MTIPTIEPKYFVAGETLKWRRSFADYPTAAGWELSYQFRSAAGGFDVTSAVIAGCFEVTVDAATTEVLLGGTYFWQAWIKKSGEAFVVGKGETTVSAPFSASEVGYDGRSVVKQTLDAIEALIAGTATINQQAYMINNRRLDRYPIPDLILLHNHYRNLYSQELRKANAKNGGGFFKNIHTRFGVPQ